MRKINSDSKKGFSLDIKSILIILILIVATLVVLNYLDLSGTSTDEETESGTLSDNSTVNASSPSIPEEDEEFPPPLPGE